MVYIDCMVCDNELIMSIEKLNEKNVLVLGANGFLGSHVVDSLLDDGFNVRAFDRFKDNSTRFKGGDSVEVVSGDFFNKGDIADALRGVDYVFHLISTTTPATAEADPLVDIDNIRGSIQLLSQCVEAKTVERVIFSSSGGTIYGDSESLLPTSELDLTLPVSPYGIGKLAIERYLAYFKKAKGLDSTAFRIANPYGERQPLLRKQGVIPIFIERILRDQPINIIGDGSMIRDFVHVRDVADMMVATLRKKDLNFDTYNIGSGRGHNIGEIVREIESVVKKKAEINYTPVPSSFVHTSVLDTSRYVGEFGEPELLPLDVGIRETVDYILDQIGQSE